MTTEFAFPFTEYNHDCSPHHMEPGMTLRDYFAAKALQGWIAAQPSVSGERLAGKNEEHAIILAEAAYNYADAMLKVRKE